MTAATLTLTEFLLARIAEDEAVARDFIAEGPWQAWATEDHRGPTRDDEYAQLNVGAGRVLAECEAKRQIVAELDRASADYDYGSGAAYAERLVLPLLALPYADHPDYREEWRPSWSG